MIEMDLLEKASGVPQDLFNTRSAVVISMDERSTEWKEAANQIHKQFRRMSIDPVAYIHYWDFDASPAANTEFAKLFAKRKIDYLFLFRFSEEKIELAIATLSNGEIDFNTLGWKSEDFSLNQLIFKLALEVKKIDAKPSNFLISDFPEIVEDIKLFDGNQYPNYPSRLTRAKLAVVLLPQLENPEGLSINDDHNLAVESMNQKIENAFTDYPYPFEIVPYQDDVTLAKSRFQYALRFVHTSGEAAKRILDYPEKSGEKDIVSAVPVGNGQRSLKKISAEKRVYKFYIQQTIVFDIHVGRYWDADAKIEIALSSFLSNMQSQFEKTQ